MRWDVSKQLLSLCYANIFELVDPRLQRKNLKLFVGKVRELSHMKVFS